MLAGRIHLGRAIEVACALEGVKQTLILGLVDGGGVLCDERVGIVPARQNGGMQHSFTADRSEARNTR